MAIALRPHGDRPWLLSLHQCAYLRRWTGVEQRLFQAIAERVNDALSGQLLLQQLRESEERYRAIFENAHDAIIVHDDRGAILAANGTMLALYGLTSEEASNLTFLDLSGADNPLEGLDDLWAQALRGGIPRFEWNARRPEDGACFPVEVMLGAIQFGHGNCILANVRDITERKRAEIALQHQERRFRALIENSSDLIALVAPEGTVLYVSPATKQVLGYEPKELLGQSAFAFMRFIRDRFAESMRHPKRPVLVQAEIRHKDGSWRFFEGVFTNCLDEPSIAAIVLNYRDITARKRAEEELRQYREHLEDLVAERTTALQRTNTELRQAMTQLVQAEKLAALGSLVAGVAHELNTPLGNARVVASGLGEHLRTFAAAVDSGALRRSQVAEFLERGREAVELLERNTARAAELIGHFKQVAVDQTSARRRHFGLRQTVEELLATLQPQFKRTAHRIELDIPAEIELDSYPGPLEQVLENLLGNSLVHGFAGRDAGVIRIRAALRAAGDVQIGYSDNGAGVPEKILKRIFDPFFTTKLGSGGSGLGLYIVYNLVTGVLGGTIEVHSAPGAGTTFTLTLPRSAPDRPALEPPV